MLADATVFVSWEEHILCQEKGNRLVHYYLKNASGDLVLAVVGTERSIRHMFYVVADEYLEAYGSLGFVDADTKWRARREVVDWLTSMVSNQLPSLGLHTSDSTEALGSRKHSMSGISALQMHLPDHMIQVQRRLKVLDKKIVWSGVAWICSKQLRHYPAFCKDGTTIAVHSFVFVLAEEERNYLGYLEDLYEDKKGQKKVKVRWFHHNWEVKGLIPQLNPHPREVFITPHVQVISAKCIDGPATVLTPKHYEKFIAIVSHPTSAGIHMCSRQFKDKKVKPFFLSILRGYSNQSIFSSLDFPILSKHKTKVHRSNREEGEDFTQKDAGRGAKRKTSFRENQKLETENGGASNLISGNQITKCEPKLKKLKLKIKFSQKEPNSIKLVESQPPSHVSFKVDDKIELLCQDSGLRGCWFRCKVLQVSQKRLKVQYVDVQDADGSGNLEEWVPASKVAAADKLDMRCSGRITIRPWPPEDSSVCSLEVGAPVDAWWSDGWWEGVVLGVDKSGNDSHHIYLPGDDRFLTVQRTNLRTSRDWSGDRWVVIKAKPDIVASISSTVSPGIKSPKGSTVAEASQSGGSAAIDCRVVTTKLDTIEEVKQKLLNLSTSIEQENREGIYLMKQLCMNDEDKVDKNADGGDGTGNEVKSGLYLEFSEQKYEAEPVEVAM